MGVEIIVVRLTLVYRVDERPSEKTAMKKLHLALSSSDIAASVADYSARLGCRPALVIEGTYALWRTETLNLSIRHAPEVAPGQLRHLGWEDDEAQAFTTEVDVNGITWERFAARHQAEEIQAAWPGTNYQVEGGKNTNGHHGT
jgi:catechol 2,3-dioxygenase-like lactoylglutathione lyase family enzyme